MERSEMSSPAARRSARTPFWTRVIGLSTLVLLAAPSAAWACRCSASLSSRAAYQRAHAVVVAEVLRVTPSPGNDGSVATLAVHQAWKRDVARDLTVGTSTTCAFDFAVGREYLLYVYATIEGGYYTSRCVGNRSLSDATRPLGWLQRNGMAAKVE